MPRVWGSWTNTSSTGARYRLGFDYTLTGTTCKIDRYVFESAYAISKSITLTRTGALTGSYSVSVSIGSSGGVVSLGRGGSFTLAYGSSKTVGGKATNVLHGLTPSISTSITNPARPPSRVSPAPTLSNIASTAATASWTAPSSNGASINNYRVQWSTSSTFSSGVSFEDVGTSRSYRITGLSANTTYYVRVRARNSADWGDWSTARSFTTLPQVPSTPSAPSVTRVSDTQMNLSWSRSASSSRPITSQRVQRRVWVDGSWGAWQTIATVSGSYTSNGSHSYSDKSTVANRVYGYRIQAVNAAGATTGDSTGNCYTTPATPTSVTASKRTNGNIRISWVRGTPLLNSVDEVQHSTNGGSSWSSLATLSSGTTTYDHVSPDPLNPHLYRVRTVVSDSGQPGNGLASSFRQSNAVQLAAPPNAPTSLQPQEVQDARFPIQLSWQHNPVDSSDQSAWELRWRVQGDTTWETISSDAGDGEEQGYELPADTWVNGGLVEWEVRTWGTHADPSPWSATAVIPLSSPPEVTITSPAPPEEGEPTVWADPLVTVDWEYYDPEDDAQSAWELQLVEPEYDTVMETVTGVGEETSASFQYVVPDGSSWLVRLRVRDGYGMWSEWVTTAFSVEYPTPVQPELGAVWDPEAGAMEVSVVNPPPTPLVEYSWDGTPDDSTSSSTAGRVNHATEPRVAATPVKWSGANTGPLWDVTHVTGDLGGGPVEWVDSYMRGEWIDEPPSPRVTTPYGVTYLGGAFTGALEGDTVAASAYVRSSTDTSVLLVLSVATPVTTYFAYANADLEAGQWTRVGQQVVLEEGDAAGVQVIVIYDPDVDLLLSTGDTLDVTALLIETNPGEDTSYFDGERPDSGNEPEVVTNDIYRQIDGGEWVLVATGIDPNGSFSDFEAASVGVNRYYAVAWSELPSAVESEIVEVVIERTNSDPGYLSAGPGYTVVARALYDLRVAPSGGLVRVQQQFAGREDPVEFSGTARTHQLAISFVTLPPEDDPDASDLSVWEQLSELRGPHLWRDPEGRRMYGSMSELQAEVLGEGAYQVSFILTRTGAR